MDYVFSTKDEVFSTLTKFYHKILNEKNLSIICIHSDHGIKFENNYFKSFCNEKKIEHNFSTPRAPQQNRIVKKKIIL